MESERTGRGAGEARRQMWREHVARQGQSGQTVRAYCAEQGVKPWQFWYWRKALKPKAAPTGGFVELCGAAAAGVVLDVAGCRVTVARGFDAELLRQVVAALRPG